MFNQQILDYITQQLQQGVSREIISSNLISQGWQQQDVKEAFSQATGQDITMQGNESFNTGDAKKNGKATTGLVLGIIGLIAWFIPIIGAPITIIGLIFSIKGLKSLKRGVAITGIVLCSIGLLATIINASIGAYMGATGQNSITNKTELIKQTAQAVKTQISLPYQIDQVTTLVDVTAESGAIRYHYVLSGVDTSKITNDLLKNSVGSGICQNEDTKNLLNQDINMEYSYSVENSAQKYFVSFTKTDCK
ncbi:MAG: DUF4190 domain-containing protein [Candidatus Nealsonbacteria bacterium]|nr:DUF4190 domain-containing protein [Candidatus Nealsonbacteria bacterium]